MQADAFAFDAHVRGRIAFGEPFARDHFRNDETGAETPSLPAKRLDADSGHRGEDDPRRHLDAAD